MIILWNSTTRVNSIHLSSVETKTNSNYWTKCFCYDCDILHIFHQLHALESYKDLDLAPMFFLAVMPVLASFKISCIHLSLDLPLGYCFWWLPLQVQDDTTVIACTSVIDIDCLVVFLN